MLLVVTATPREAEPLRALLAAAHDTTRHGVPISDGHLHDHPVRLAVTGVGRGATAFHLSRLLLDQPPVVLQVGVGGSFDPDVLPIGALACASSDTYADLGVRTDDGWIDAETLGFPLAERGGQRWFDRFPTDPDLTAAVAGALDTVVAPFATVETVTGTSAARHDLHARTGALVESMEGAAAAHACVLADVPFVEVRAASNLVGPRDRAAWRLDDAIAAVGRAAARAASVLAGRFP